jgi:hypothetical protein
MMWQVYRVIDDVAIWDDVRANALALWNDDPTHPKFRYFEDTAGDYGVIQ